MTSWVLDASAVLAFVLGEFGSDRVRECLPGGKWSSVNYAETLARLTEISGSLEHTRAHIDALELELIPFDAEQAAQTAALRAVTKQQGLSLGDRACLALAITYKAAVVTADLAWSQLDLGVEVVQIRRAA